MEYSLYNKKVYCKSSPKYCVTGKQGPKGDTGKTDIQYAIIRYTDISFDLSGVDIEASYNDLSTVDLGVLNNNIFDDSTGIIDLTNINNKDDYLVEIIAHLDINFDKNNTLSIFMNLTDISNSSNIIDIDTRTIAKKQDVVHGSFGPVLYKLSNSELSNNRFKLIINKSFDDQNPNDFLSEIKLIIKLIKYK